ncbi:hypothetical protein PYW07_016963 [Mythimna separata]|uniref:Uncharacterized protein n=1 Tax=Mythimna separata TaxID=271217 RepID=A0AAD7YVR4_MYTSE|nr:hypothetical protein PYW07_016963 [Mythimna separata]
MAGTHLAFTLLVLAGLEDIQANLNPHGGSMNVKPHLDPKRRSEILDETFLEQKDVLLELLETKLKEVREKRKKKTVSDVNAINSNIGLEHLTHDKHLENLDVKALVNGISAIGESNVELKYGTGKRLVQLDAQGISNIGKALVELVVGENGLFIPGLTALLTGPSHTPLNSTNNVSSTELPTVNTDRSRRNGVDENIHVSTTTAVTTRTEVIPLATVNATVTVTVPSNNTTNSTGVYAAAAAAAAAEALGGGGRRAPPPLLRSRTLPAIIAPGFSILHAQIDPQRTNNGK